MPLGCVHLDLKHPENNILTAAIPVGCVNLINCVNETILPHRQVEFVRVVGVLVGCVPVRFLHIL